MLDTIAEIGNISIGDRLLFSIQGVPLETRVTSIRSRVKSKLHPFFYFVFKEEVLQSAPKTFFAALHVPKEDIPDVITKVVKEIPNISTINVSDMAVQFGRLFRRLSVIIAFFSSFSILAGLLIMTSVVFATRPDRIREVAYYKVLGADSWFIMQVMLVENVIIGLFSALIALCFASASSYLICRFVFEIRYTPHLAAIAGMILLAVALVVTVGMVSGYGIMRQKPADFLRLQEGR